MTLFGSLYCEETGAHGRETLVLLHGGGASHRVWSGALPHLTSDFHILLPDLLEHGRSGGAFTVQVTTDRVAEAIEALGRGGRAHFAGLSVGAEVGLDLLARYPQRVSSAFLSGPLIYPPRWLELARNPRYRPLARALFTAYAPIRNFPLMVWLHCWRLGIPRAQWRDYAEDVARLSVDGFTRMVHEYLDFEASSALGRVRVPTLLAVGPLELRGVQRTVDEIARRMPEGHAVTAPVVQHNWLLEKPELFARAVRTWAFKNAWPEELEERESVDA